VEKESSIVLEDYNQWVEANQPQNFSLFDYIHGVFTTEELPPDLAFSLFGLFWPDFIILDNLIFLQTEFSEEKYQKLKLDGIEKQEIEYWMNLLNVDKLINCKSTKLSLQFASQLANSWKRKLETDYPNRKFDVQAFSENGDLDSEVYIFFQQKKA